MWLKWIGVSGRGWPGTVAGIWKCQSEGAPADHALQRIWLFSQLRYPRLGEVGSAANRLTDS